MHPAILFFIRGHVFFPAVILAALGALVAAYVPSRAWRLFAAVNCYTGVLLTLASGTPQP